MSLPPLLIEKLSGLLKSKINLISSLGGGCISQAGIISTAEEKRYFLKWNMNVNLGFFEAEACGLQELESAQAIKVPKVICYEDNGLNQPSFIVMEELEARAKTKEDSKQLARGLARLHQKKADQYGFVKDNFIGALPQTNSQMAQWGNFFFENRLVKQAELGSEAGWFDYNFERLLIKRKDKIISLLDEVDWEKPSLLHGDLWGGNVFWSSAGPALIDPAVYYGNREADLAFSELFGGFDKIFYQVYNEAYPLCPGYEKRKNILNLYHLMTHANLFGGGYISSAYSALTKI